MTATLPKDVNTSISIGGKVLPNRIVFQPMEGCDGTDDGAIGELTARRYMRFAMGGAAIIWLEAVSVSKEARANPRQLYLNENTKESFRKLIKDIKEASMAKFGFAPLIVMQSTHSGRYSKPFGTPKPLVAYRNAFWEKSKEQQNFCVVTDEYCDNIVESYAVSARLAAEVGVDAIDVKCCHGYLLNEFLSAYDRAGKYGGTLENRARLYLDCIEAVKRNISSDMWVTTRINACDCFPYPYGYGVNASNQIDLSECKWIISKLIDKGISLVNITIGNPYLIPHINRPCIDAPESGEEGLERFYHITKEIQDTFKNLTVVASGLSFPQEKCIQYANKLLSEGIAEMVGFGRMTFAYPGFYIDYLKNGKIEKQKCCIRCSKCSQLMRSGSVTGCPIRDKEIYLPLYQKFVLKKEI